MVSTANRGSVFTRTAATRSNGNASSLRPTQANERRFSTLKLRCPFLSWYLMWTESAGSAMSERITRPASPSATWAEPIDPSSPVTRASSSLSWGSVSMRDMHMPCSSAGGGVWISNRKGVSTGR